MKKTFWCLYDALVIRHPLWTLSAFGLLLLLAVSGLPQSRFEVSADSLVLEDDQALGYYRQTRRRYPESSSCWWLSGPWRALCWIRRAWPASPRCGMTWQKCPGCCKCRAC